MSRKVKVRIPVAIDWRGHWWANGGDSGRGPTDHFDDCLCDLELGERRYWITAEIEAPSPPSEASEVEGTTTEPNTAP